MPNNRVFYASQGVKVGGTTVQGAQSAGVTTNFNLEQAFQLGQLAIYDNIITDPEVTVTISKVLDGRPTVWQLATGGGSLVNNANDVATVVIGVGDDTDDALTSTTAITCTGMFISSVSYAFPVDSNFTEEVTLVGNHKSLEGSVSAPSASGSIVLRRQNLASSTLPSEVDGQNITNITVSADLGRESMYKLGQYGPFHRFVNFPLEVTTEIEVSATGVDTTELDLSLVNCVSSGLPSEQEIIINLCEGSGGTTYYRFNMGTKNRLQSVNYSGGDTGGGNATITYTYVTYNELSISG
jgi:hypothetical protein